jgi:hypothetical protein
MEAASSINRHKPVTEASREYPTKWTWYADDHSEKKQTKQAPRESLCGIEEDALIVQGNSL